MNRKDVKTKRSGTIDRFLKGSWNKPSSRTSVSSFYRSEERLPAIVEQSCAYLEQHGKFHPKTLTIQQNINLLSYPKSITNRGYF